MEEFTPSNSLSVDQIKASTEHLCNIMFGNMLEVFEQLEERPYFTEEIKPRLSTDL
jgi:hypothetical protein